MAGKAIAYGTVHVEVVHGRVDLKVDEMMTVSLSADDALLLAQELSGAWKTARIQAFVARAEKIKRGEA